MRSVCWFCGRKTRLISSCAAEPPDLQRVLGVRHDVTAMLSTVHLAEWELPQGCDSRASILEVAESGDFVETGPPWRPGQRDGCASPDPVPGAQPALVALDFLSRHLRLLPFEVNRGLEHLSEWCPAPAANGGLIIRAPCAARAAWHERLRTGGYLQAALYMGTGSGYRRHVDEVGSPPCVPAAACLAAAATVGCCAFEDASEARRHDVDSMGSAGVSPDSWAAEEGGLDATANVSEPTGGSSGDTGRRLTAIVYLRGVGDGSDGGSGVRGAEGQYGGELELWLNISCRAQQRPSERWWAEAAGFKGRGHCPWPSAHDCCASLGPGCGPSLGAREPRRGQSLVATCACRIIPAPGKLLLFWSQCTPHEVLPLRVDRARGALTLWMTR